jgi:hypothetical protein
LHVHKRKELKHKHLTNKEHNITELQNM